MSSESRPRLVRSAEPAQSPQIKADISTKAPSPSQQSIANRRKGSNMRHIGLSSGYTDVQRRKTAAWTDLNGPYILLQKNPEFPVAALIHEPLRAGSYNIEFVPTYLISLFYCCRNFHNICFSMPSQISASREFRLRRRSSRRTLSSVDASVPECT